MDNVFLLTGIAFILIGFILIVVGSLTTGNAKVAVGGFIGPIPFGFGNDPGLLRIVIIISAVTMLIFVLALLR
ncbi:MAG: DUF131 domain-containing protein [Candidatus Aenigmarchaeota archaeon]|nr:DUF131 domain-containing protein [Candidatus Aenigmarchaeota archaeon]